MHTVLAILLAAIALTLAAPAAHAAEEAPSRWAATVYGAQISSEATWQHLLKDPLGAGFVDSWLLVGALSRNYASLRDGALAFEAEGQLAYHFGEQDHWELNAVPIVARWQRFPWSGRFFSAAAFGLGLSYSTDLPEVELRLEDTTRRWMVYWMLEFAAGPRDAPWAVSLRIHHRSDAFGLMGEDGGMNAVGLGFRYRF